MSRLTRSWPGCRPGGRIPGLGRGLFRSQHAGALAQLLDDPYDSVRFVASGSLRKRPPFEDFAYDFVGPASQRRGAARRAAAGGAFTHANAAKDNDAAILIDASGSLETERFSRLLRTRDDLPVDLRE